MIKLKKILFKKYVWIPLAAIILIAGVIWGIQVKNRPSYTTVPAVRGDFVQVISVTGKVVPAKNVDLSFEASGRVAGVNVEVGNKVSGGKTLATLSAGDAYASLAAAQARLETEQIKLRDLESGTRPEELTLKQTAKTQAETSLKNSLIDAYIDSDDLIQNKINALFHRNGSDREDIIPFGDAALKASLDERKRKIDEMLINWKDNTQSVQGTLDNLQILRPFLTDVALAVSQMTPTPTLSQATIDQYKSYVSTARASVNSSIAAVNSAKDALKTAEENLNLSQAGANPYDIEAQKAVVRTAQASVAQYQALASQNIIFAPFDGIITRVDIDAGGSASPATPSISMISAANFEIESFVAEADIAKIHLHDRAKVTLDAYGGDAFFDAVITKIDPAETVVEGVSTYRATLQFTQQDERIKSGMTANIDVQGQIRPNVLTVPQSAIIYDDEDNKTVYVLRSGKKKPDIVSVRTGQVDDKGNVEITDGLSEGDMVATNPPRN